MVGNFKLSVLGWVKPDWGLQKSNLYNFLSEKPLGF